MYMRTFILTSKSNLVRNCLARLAKRVLILFANLQDSFLTTYV